MPRYYYTDPLKAAWMAREFGAKFVEDDYNSATEACYMNVTDSTDQPFYIHPDSLPIFEPKVGDRNECGHILTSINPKEVYEDWLSEDDGRIGVAYYVDDEGVERDLLLKDIKIIQRDNKAFFMPEVEE